MNSAPSPPRQRSSSTRIRGRPMPGVRSGALGADSIRQRVTAALGGASAVQRRSSSAVTPLA